MPAQVLLILVSQVKCFLPITNAALIAQSKGAIAVIYVLEQNAAGLVTLAGGEEVDGFGSNSTTIKIPVYTVEHDVGVRMREQLETCDNNNICVDVVITLPMVTGGVAEENIAADIDNEQVGGDDGNERVKLVTTDVNTGIIDEATVSLAVMLVVVTAVCGRLWWRKRRNARALGVYNTVDSGTQFNPIGMGMGMGMGGGVVSASDDDGGGGGDSEGFGVGGGGGGRTLAARPWNGGFWSQQGGAGATTDINTNTNTNINTNTNTTEAFGGGLEMGQFNITDDDDNDDNPTPLEGSGGFASSGLRRPSGMALLAVTKTDGGNKEVTL